MTRTSRNRKTLKGLPRPPRTSDPQVNAWMEAVQARLEADDAARPNSNTLDKVLRMRDLVNTGAFKIAQAIGKAGPGIDYVQPGLVNLSTPPAPTGLAASGALASIVLSWDTAPYANHAYTKVYRQAAEDEQGDPVAANFGQAVMVGTSASSIYADHVGAGGRFHYWARFVSAAGIEGLLSTHAAGETGQDPAYVLAVLAGEVTETQLHADLNSRINLIDTPDTGLVDRASALETNFVALQVSEEAARQDIAETVLDALVTAQDAFQQHYDDESWRDAVSTVDPETGEIQLYAVEALRTETETEFSTVNATLDAHTASLNLKASKTYVDETAAAILAGFEPAYEWEFQSSADGFTGHNATLTTGTEKLTITPDAAGESGIEASGLSYAGGDNDNIRILVQRTGGTGWVGRVYWATSGHGFSSSYYREFSAPADDGEAHVVQANMRSPTAGGTDYVDNQITGLRIVFGDTISDTFEVDRIEVGKSAIEQLLLDDLQARVTQAEVDIDGVEAEVTLKASQTEVDGIDDRLTDAEGELVVQAGQIAAKALQSDMTAAESNITQAQQDISAIDGRVKQSVADMTVLREVDDKSAEAQLDALLYQNSQWDQNRTVRVRLASAEQTIEAHTDELSAEATARLALETRVDDNEAAVLSEQTARSDGDSALASDINALTATVEDPDSGLAAAHSAITTEQTARATADSALASDISTLETSVGNNATAIQNEQTARANADSALADDITTLETTVGGNTASIQEHATSIDGLHAQWTLKQDVNGHVAGIGLASTTNDEGQVTSDFAVLADRFSISFPAHPWAAETTYSLGDFVKPSTPNGFVYRATLNGDSGAAEPTWPEIEGDTVSDGTTQWEAVTLAATVPFVVALVDGVPTVVANTAVITNLTVENLKAGDGAFDLISAVDGKINLQYISRADIFDLIVGNLIQSDNYVAGSAGWQVDKTGAAEFSEITIRDSSGKVLLRSSENLSAPAAHNLLRDGKFLRTTADDDDSYWNFDGSNFTWQATGGYAGGPCAKLTSDFFAHKYFTDPVYYPYDGQELFVWTKTKTASSVLAGVIEMRIAFYDINKTFISQEVVLDYADLVAGVWETKLKRVAAVSGAAYYRAWVWLSFGIVETVFISEIVVSRAPIGQITPTNASTYIADLAVDTLQIAEHAASVPAGAYSLMGATGGSFPSSRILATATIGSTIGSPRSISFSVFVESALGGTTDNPVVRLRRNANGTTTTLLEGEFEYATYGSPRNITGVFHDEAVYAEGATISYEVYHVSGQEPHYLYVTFTTSMIVTETRR